jgi:hypothetical protein
MVMMMMMMMRRRRRRGAYMHLVDDAAAGPPETEVELGGCSREEVVAVAGVMRGGQEEWKRPFQQY